MSISYGGDYITDSDGGKLRPSSAVMRNRIINGAMVINQRGFSGTPSNEYTLDRWNFSNSTTGKATISQSSDAPTGFVNSLLVTSSSAYSATGSDFFGIQQRIEGYNIADLSFGTASAKTITISFWVKSSLTGTFSGAINNGAWDTSYAFTYSITAANTWEQKSVTIAGATSGTWLTTNGNGMRVWFSMGLGTTYATTANTWVTSSGSYGATGSTSVVGTSGATFYITGVQLEVGSVATGFEYRQYGQELALCQRYYFQTQATASNWNYIGTGLVWSSSTTFTYLQYPVLMRSAPTVSTFGTINSTNVQVLTGSASTGATAVAGAGSVETNSICTRIDFTTPAVLTNGQSALPRFAQNTGVTVSAEL